ncbi:hypothetical protein TNCT_666661 [Trichonephila clavata]|uniref:Uncharacterized protein n=1 Tax=Trichonephila clavata TaxID=2740835 RepID=A0A8X6L952_TRICU|nr:hypothetical protein TNCT_666661 [Trichonephila clavata]
MKKLHYQTIQTGITPTIRKKVQQELFSVSWEVTNIPRNARSIKKYVSRPKTGTRKVSPTPMSIQSLVLNVDNVIGRSRNKRD